MEKKGIEIKCHALEYFLYAAKDGVGKTAKDLKTLHLLSSRRRGQYFMFYQEYSEYTGKLISFISTIKRRDYTSLISLIKKARDSERENLEYYKLSKVSLDFIIPYEEIVFMSSDLVDSISESSYMIQTDKTFDVLKKIKKSITESFLDVVEDVAVSYEQISHSEKCQILAKKYDIPIINVMNMGGDEEVVSDYKKSLINALVKLENMSVDEKDGVLKMLNNNFPFSYKKERLCRRTLENLGILLPKDVVIRGFDFNIFKREKLLLQA